MRLVFFCLIFALSSALSVGGNGCKIPLSSSYKIDGSLLEIPELFAAISRANLQAQILHLDLLDARQGFLTPAVLRNVSEIHTTFPVVVGKVVNLNSVYMMLRFVDEKWNFVHRRPKSHRSYFSFVLFTCETMTWFVAQNTRVTDHFSCTTSVLGWAELMKNVTKLIEGAINGSRVE